MTDRPTDMDAGPRIVVLSGLHASACCGLPLGTCSIGSDAADAVVLGDPGIVPGHLTLDVQEVAVTVHAAHDGVALGGMSLPPGSHLVAALPFELAIAGVVLRFEAERCETSETCGGEPAGVLRPSFLAKIRPKLQSSLRPAALACAVAALGLLMAGVNSIASVAGKAGPPFAAMLAAQASTSQTLAGPPAAMPDPSAASAAPASRGKASGPPGASNTGPAGLATALQELQAELSTRSLAGIQLAASGGTIMARGRLDPRSEAEWRLVQQWFDGRYSRYGREATLIDEVRFAAVPAASVAVDAVWTGRNPNVVIKGQKFFEGATLPNGFHLERISPGELLVEREGQRQALKF